MSNLQASKVTVDNLTTEQIVKFRDANIVGPYFQIARIALGQCCIPCTSREVAGVYAERCPTMTERYLARAEIARMIVQRGA